MKADKRRERNSVHDGEWCVLNSQKTLSFAYLHPSIHLLSLSLSLCGGHSLHIGLFVPAPPECVEDAEIWTPCISNNYFHA